MQFASRCRRLLFVFTIAVLLSLLLAACGDNETTPASKTADPSAALTPAESAIVTFDDVLRKDPALTKRAQVEWGWLFEQSGAFSPLGKPAGDGVLIAVGEINAAGGFQVGDTIYTINLDQYDSKSDPTAALAAATELVRDKGVNVIWGPTGPGDAEAAAVTQREHVLHLCPCPHRELALLSSPEQAAGPSRWAFQTAARQSVLIDLIARELAQAHPEMRTFAAVCTASELGRSYCRFFRDSFLLAGFDVIDTKLAPPEMTDFTPVLTGLKGDDPDILLNLLDGGLATFTFLRQSWELDVGQVYLSPAVQVDLLETLSGVGIRDKLVLGGATPRTEVAPTSSKAQRFFQDVYKPFVGGTLPPGAFVALTTYDAVYMLVAAMQQAGTVDDTGAIAAALERVHFDGIGEDDLYFDSSHIMVSGADICTITQGAYQECHHLVPSSD